ncbi:hypothetical protein SCUCBS95973_006388 [Sporothrix curviconia]|uniref:Kelch repeat protein n=1 Tax=Sporothrix curviconia TaxID=1260050 RepID=A0ABP0C773_9PEZI
MPSVLRTSAAAGLLAAAGLYATPTAAQASGWIAGQVNATMCYWEQPRAAVVRDTLYIDGGNLWWIPGMNTSAYGSVTNDQNPLGIVWTLNFSVPFTTSDNITADMGMLYKVAAGSSANNVAPNYVDGAMLANDDEWFLYGGLLVDTDQFALPDGDAAQLYQQYQYGADKPSFRPGFINVDLPANVTRYVAYGGAASAPSENKAWYFSGLRSPTYGPIYTVSGVDALTAINVSDTLITVDMATQNSETWTNATLLPPSSSSSSSSSSAETKGRANPSLVWVPVGAQGILVAVGGVLDPEWVSVSGKSENANASAAASPAFLTTIDVYDVASKTWYQQPTTGGGSLGQRTRGCAVVAAAQDASSFNIYYYGGFDGLHVGDTFNDDVWVLSLPSFTWTQVYASSDAATHGRAGHQCVTPYPDQMFVVGGYTPQAGNGVGCLGGGIVQLFNLSAATWMDSYTPTQWSAYSVPDAVAKVIGGNGAGGATATAPAAAGGWAATGLKSVFATAYPTSKLTHYYPYPLNQSSTSSTNPDVPSPSPSSSGHHTPAFVAPLVGVLGGLIVVTAAAVGIVLYRRRRILMYGSSGVSGSGGRRSSRGGPTGGSGHPGTESVATYDTGHNFVFSWLRAQPSVKHTSTTPATSSYDDPHSYGNSFGNSHSTRVQSFGPNSTGTPISPEMEQLQMAAVAAGQAGGQQGYLYGHGQQQQHGGAPAAVEADSTYISEMIADTKYRAELPGSELSTTDTASASTRFTRGVNSGNGISNSSGNGSNGNYYYHGVPSSSAELESPLQHGNAVGQQQQQQQQQQQHQQQQQQEQPIARADSPSLGQQPQYATVSPAATAAAVNNTSAPSPRFRESGVSDLSEQDRRHLRQGSDGGQSTMSGVSSALGGAGGSYFHLHRGSDPNNNNNPVSPLGSQFPAPITGQQQPPQPIPEADVGAEAAAEAAAQSTPLSPEEGVQPTPPPPLQSPSQTSLPTPGPSGGGGDSPGQLRRSAFRESEVDLTE